MNTSGVNLNSSRKFCILYEIARGFLNSYTIQYLLGWLGLEVDHKRIQGKIRLS